MKSSRGGAPGPGKPPDTSYTTFSSGCRGSGLYACIPSKRLSTSRNMLCSLPGCEDEDFPSQGWSGSQNQLIFAGPLRSGVGDRLVKNPIYIDSPLAAPVPLLSPSSPAARPSPPPSPTSSTADQHEGQSLVFGSEENDLEFDLDHELQAELDLDNVIESDLEHIEDETGEREKGETRHCNVKDTHRSAKVTECSTKVKETSTLQGTDAIKDVTKDVYVTKDVFNVTKDVARDACADESTGALRGVPGFVTVFDPGMPRSGRGARGVTGSSDGNVTSSSRHGSAATTTSPRSPPTPPPPPLPESYRLSPPLQESGSDVPLVPSATSSDTVSDCGDQRRSVSFIPGTADNEGKVGRKVTRHRRQGSGGASGGSNKTTKGSKDKTTTGSTGSKEKCSAGNHRDRSRHATTHKATSSTSSSTIELTDNPVHTSSTSVTSRTSHTSPGSRQKTPRGGRRSAADADPSPHSADTTRTSPDTTRTSPDTDTRLQVEDDSLGHPALNTAKPQKDRAARTMEDPQKDSGASPNRKNTAKDRAERAKRHKSGEKNKMSNAAYDQMIKKVVKRTRKNRMCNVAIIMVVALIILGIAAFVTVHFSLKQLNNKAAAALAASTTTPASV